MLSGETSVAEGYALTPETGCFPLATRQPQETLHGVLSTDPRLALLYRALSGDSVVLPGGARLFLADDSAKGAWRFEDWSARWGEIAPLAWDEIKGGSWPDAAALQQRLPMILSRAAAQVAARRGKPADIRSGEGRDKVQVEAEETPHAGFFLTRSYRLRHPLFGGGQSAALEREVFVATDAAIVLPYDPVRDRVLLVEQFRMGPFGRGDARPWMLEPVAGRVDGGEAPETTARRECREEAGLDLTGLEHIASHYCSPGCSTEYFHCYLGRCDLPDLLKGQGGLATEHEDIRTHVLPYATAQTLLTTGEADNGPLILMLYWLAANRDRLRASP